MAVARRYQMLRPVPCCCLLLSMRRIYWHGIVPFTTTLRVLIYICRLDMRDIRIYVRANSSIEWVHEWGVRYGQVGSGCVPVANRLSWHAVLRASSAILSVASARKGNIWLVMQRVVES